MPDIEHENTSEIVCPHCGIKQPDSWEHDDNGEIDCDCGKTFNYERNTEVTYTSYAKE